MKKSKTSLRDEIRPAKVKEINGTGRIGTVHASYDELIEIFGQPHDRTAEGEWRSKFNKIRVEWAFVIDEDKKLVFTIYDYKSRYPLEKIKQWSLGGKNDDVKKYLLKILLVE